MHVNRDKTNEIVPLALGIKGDRKNPAQSIPATASGSPRRTSVSAESQNSGIGYLHSIQNTALRKVIPDSVLESWDPPKVVHFMSDDESEVDVPVVEVEQPFVKIKPEFEGAQ